MSVAVLSHASVTRTSAVALADLDEPTLIERAKSGDRDAFGELYHRYEMRVYGFVLSLIRRHPADAEDITAEVFASAMRTIGNFSTDQPTPFKAWLFSIARHRVLDWRRRGVRREQPAAEIERGADPGRYGKPEAVVLDRLEVQDLLSRLPTRLRQVLMLRFACDLPTDEVSRVMRAYEMETSYVARTSEMMVRWLTSKAIAAVDEQVLASETRRRVRRFLADPNATWQPTAATTDPEAA